MLSRRAVIVLCWRVKIRFAKRPDAIEIISRRSSCVCAVRLWWCELTRAARARGTNSIAPSLYGHEDAKRAIACLLFGGTRKVLFFYKKNTFLRRSSIVQMLPDGGKLRGDINVLLIG